MWIVSQIINIETSPLLRRYFDDGRRTLKPWTFSVVATEDSTALYPFFPHQHVYGKNGDFMFRTKEEAEEAANKWLASDESRFDVFLVLVNSDLDSGSGPMRPDKVFPSWYAACTYCSQQKGVQGRSQTLYHIRFGINILGGGYVRASFPDFNIEPMKWGV